MRRFYPADEILEIRFAEHFRDFHLEAEK